VDETWIHYFTPDEGTVKIMDFSGWTSFEEGEDRKIGRKGDGHSFLGCTRYNSSIPSVEANNQWWLHSIIGPFQQHFKEKTSPFGEEESALPSRQYIGSSVPDTDDQIQWIPLRIVSSSSIFARFSLLRLFPVSKPEEMVQRKEIHYQRAAHRRNRGLFWRIRQIILFG